MSNLYFNLQKRIFEIFSNIKYGGKMYKKIILAVITFLIFSCSAKTRENTKPTLFVSILPQKYFVKRIAGDIVDINVMVKPGHNPATYEPTMKQMSMLGISKTYFSIGVPFEKAWLPKIKDINQNLLIVDTSKGIKRRVMDNFSKSQNRQNVKLTDPHIWLAPKLVKIQAKNIYETLLTLFPAQKDTFTRNYKNFLDDLDNLHQNIAQNLSNLKGREFAVFHPSWGYFADEFSLKQIPIEIEGKSPSAKKLSKIIKILKKNKIKTVFVQEQFDTRLAKSIADEISGKVIAIDPLSEDYINNLTNISKTMKTELDN